MKALILAAGLGSRLRPLTDNVPKCMVEVNGVSIIDKQINNLRKSGVEDIFIITGYKEDVLQNHIKKSYNDLNIRIISNSDYDKTNNMYSLYLANEYLSDSEFVMMNSDVFFEAEIIEELLNDKYENLIVCEKDNYNEESMKIIVENNIINEISKKISSEESYGTSIDVYRFGKEASKKLFEIIYDYLYVRKDLNSWSEVAINDLIKKVSFQPLNIKYKWMEIDNHEDLAIAEKLFK